MLCVLPTQGREVKPQQGRGGSDPGKHGSHGNTSHPLGSTAVFVLVVLVIEVCSFTPWREGKEEQEATRDERCRCWKTRGWTSEPHGLSSDLNLSLSASPPPSQLLPGRNVLPVGPVRSFCWTVPCLDLPHLPLLLLPAEWVLGNPCSYSPRSAPPVPATHVLIVTLACVNMALSSESRAHEEGTEQ